MSAGGSLPRISIVIPMMNEAENASPLIKGICAACEGEGVAFEVVAVNDGSTDGTGAVLEGLAKADPRVRVLCHAAPAGQSAAVHSGVRAARGEIICTLDGDGQNPPDQLPKLFKPLLADDIRQTGAGGRAEGGAAGYREQALGLEAGQWPAGHDPDRRHARYWLRP